MLKIAHKNKYNALVVISWGSALMGIGTIIGAQSGLLLNASLSGYPDYFYMLILALVVISLTYFVFSFRMFSFEALINTVNEYKKVSERDANDDFSERAQKISQEYNLTPRESEIFELLARGRNRKYLEEELGISRNTVKVHVQNIYNKLQIHSHQELIDLLDT